MWSSDASLYSRSDARPASPGFPAPSRSRGVPSALNSIIEHLSGSRILPASRQERIGLRTVYSESRFRSRLLQSDSRPSSVCFGLSRRPEQPCQQAKRRLQPVVLISAPPGRTRDWPDLPSALAPCAAVACSSVEAPAAGAGGGPWLHSTHTLSRAHPPSALAPRGADSATCA